jgi:hypothetical protein
VGEERWRAAEHAEEGALSEPPPTARVPAGTHAHWRWRSLELPPRPESVPAARRWAAEVLREWAAEDLEWVVAQLLTELATNVVLHGGTTFEIRLGHDPSRPGLVRGEVIDGNSVLPRRRRHSTSATTGRGLEMLENASARWGAERDGSGKVVWFEAEAGGNGAGPGLDLDQVLDLLNPETPSPPAPVDRRALQPRRQAPARAEGSSPGPTAVRPSVVARIPGPGVPAQRSAPPDAIEASGRLVPQRRTTAA